uniref:Uncharacterized protein n=1 Tax=Setaria italica TaxID=4555 RepID=K3XNZ8_SETIT
MISDLNDRTVYSCRFVTCVLLPARVVNYQSFSLEQKKASSICVVKVDATPRCLFVARLCAGRAIEGTLFFL